MKNKRILVGLMCGMFLTCAVIVRADWEIISGSNNPTFTIRVPYDFQNLHEDVTKVLITCMVGAGPIRFRTSAGVTRRPGQNEHPLVDNPDGLRGAGDAQMRVDENNRSFQGTVEIPVVDYSRDISDVTDYGCIFWLRGPGNNYSLPRTGTDDPEWAKPAGEGAQMLVDLRPAVYGRVPR